MKLLNVFLKDEDGAVTVDWVVLTAAIVGIGIAVAAAIKTGLDTAAGSVAASITDAVT